MSPLTCELYSLTWNTQLRLVCDSVGTFLEEEINNLVSESIKNEIYLIIYGYRE